MLPDAEPLQLSLQIGHEPPPAACQFRESLSLVLDWTLPDLAVWKEMLSPHHRARSDPCVCSSEDQAEAALPSLASGASRGKQGLNRVYKLLCLETDHVLGFSGVGFF